MESKREAQELLLIEEADSWFEYLAATRGQTAVRYQEVEPARHTNETRQATARGSGLTAACPGLIRAC